MLQNKTKYFRLRLSYEVVFRDVRELRPETDLRAK